MHQRPKIIVANPGTVNNGGICSAPDCKARIALEKLMCAEHFQQVPNALQKRIMQATSVIEQSHAGDKHANEDYQRLRLKAIQSLSGQNTPTRKEIPPEFVLQCAKNAALRALFGDGLREVDVAWHGIYGTLQAHKICTSQLGIAKRCWDAGELWDAEALRAQIEAFKL